MGRGAQVAVWGKTSPCPPPSPRSNGTARRPWGDHYLLFRRYVMFQKQYFKKTEMGGQAAVRGGTSPAPSPYVETVLDYSAVARATEVRGHKPKVGGGALNKLNFCA